MAYFVGLDVSLKMISICIVDVDGTVVWQGKALSERPALILALSPYRDRIKLVGIEACPLTGIRSFFRPSRKRPFAERFNFGLLGRAFISLNLSHNLHSINGYTQMNVKRSLHGRRMWAAE